MRREVVDVFDRIWALEKTQSWHNLGSAKNEV